jgi:hypothetical protein
MDSLQIYWIEHYARLGLSSKQIKKVLKINMSDIAFRKALNRRGIKTERTKSNEYYDLVIRDNL